MAPLDRPWPITYNDHFLADKSWPECPQTGFQGFWSINQSIDNWSIIDNRLIESENRWRQSIRHGRKPMIHQLLGHYRLRVWPRVNFCFYGCFYGCIPGCGRIRPNRFFWNRRNTTCSNSDFLQIFLQSVLRPILNYKKIKKVGCLTDHEINIWPWPQKVITFSETSS